MKVVKQENAFKLTIIKKARAYSSEPAYDSFQSINLTLFCLVDYPIRINWMSPFQILGVPGVFFFFFFFHFYSNSCKQTV